MSSVRKLSIRGFTVSRLRSKHKTLITVVTVLALFFIFFKVYHPRRPEQPKIATDVKSEMDERLKEKNIIPPENRQNASFENMSEKPIFENLLPVDIVGDGLGDDKVKHQIAKDAIEEHISAVGNIQIAQPDWRDIQTIGRQ